MKSFTDIKDLSKSDIEAILFRTRQEKKIIAEKGILNIEKILLGKTVALIFEKPSTRTRVSFEVGISQLGGHSSVLQASDIQLSRGESISDTARVLSKYVDLIIVRCFKHQMMIDLANLTVESIDSQYGSVYVNDGSGTAKIDDYFFNFDQGEWPDLSVGDTINSIMGVVH